MSLQRYQPAFDMDTCARLKIIVRRQYEGVLSSAEVFYRVDKVLEETWSGLSVLILKAMIIAEGLPMRTLSQVINRRMRIVVEDITLNPEDFLDALKATGGYMTTESSAAILSGDQKVKPKDMLLLLPKGHLKWFGRQLMMLHNFSIFKGSLEPSGHTNVSFVRLDDENIKVTILESPDANALLPSNTFPLSSQRTFVSPTKYVMHWHKHFTAGLTFETELQDQDKLEDDESYRLEKEAVTKSWMDWGWKKHDRPKDVGLTYEYLERSIEQQAA